MLILFAFRRSVFLISLIFILWTSASSTPALASNKSSSTYGSEREKEVLLNRVEWRLRMHLAKQCPREEFVSGMFIAPIYKIGRKMGIKSLPKAHSAIVLHVNDRSPADISGLEVGDEIISIGGYPIDELLNSWDEEVRLDDQIKWFVAQYRDNSKLGLHISRNGIEKHIQIQLESACASRIYLNESSNIKASTDGKNISISRGLLRFIQNEDELALIAGHEFAHIFLHDGRRKGLFGTRNNEDEADYMGAEISKCAGFDVNAAINFWTRHANSDWLGFLRSPSHRSSRDRANLLESALPNLKCGDVVD